MRRIFALAAMIALTLGLIAPSLTTAQTGTPVAESESGFGVALGTTMPYIGADGAQIGTITVESITDPFDGYDQFSAPQRGYHYALAEITVTNDSNRPFEVNPGSMMGIDSDGFVADQPYLSFTDPSMTELEYTDALAPGTSVTGQVPYALFGDSTIARIVYSPSYDRLITLVDLRTAPAVPGTPVSIMSTTGTELAQVTVDGVTAPFEGYDASSAPARGSSYVALEVTVANTGTAVLSVSPSDFWLTDADGFVLSTSDVTRTDTTVPDYDYADLNPGDSQHGMLVYQIFEGVPAAQVNYGDGYTALNVVADLSAGTGTPATTTTPVPPATEVAVAPTAIAPPTDVVSSPACEGLVDWGLDLVDRITRAATLVAPLQTADPSTLDPTVLRDVATQLRAIGDEQAASNPPTAAAEVNTLMTEQFYYPLADAADQIAGAVEENNAAGALAGQMAAEKVTQVFDDGGAYDLATQALTTACPTEVDQLNNQ